METRKNVNVNNNNEGSEQKEKISDTSSTANNNNQIPSSLTKLAFKAFLRARKEFDFEISDDYNSVIEQQQLKLAPDFLQAIANANPSEVKNFLDDCPELAVIARGTVTTISGHTYQDVSALQLAYLMDDVEMCNMMLPYIKKLPEDMIKKADEQLVQKMAEVEKQRAEFKPYDFTEIVKAITADQTLKNTGRPSPETEAALAKFKEDFKPSVITFGKSWIKENLQEGYRVYDANWNPWNGNQLQWYLINIIGHKQTLAEKCFEQECSQGLKEIVDEQKPSQRTSKIKNYMNNAALTYRGSQDGSLLLGRDFCVEVYYGSWAGTTGRSGWRVVENLCRAKRSGMEKFKQQLDQLQPSHQEDVGYKKQGCQIV